MSREEGLRAVDDLVELPPGTLQGSEKLEDLENWNSMAMIGFIALADANGARLSPRQLAGCNTVEELLQVAKIF